MTRPSNWLINVNRLRNLFQNGAVGSVTGRNMDSITIALEELKDSLEIIFSAGALTPSDTVGLKRLPTAGTLTPASFVKYTVFPPTIGVAAVHAAIAQTAAIQTITTLITNPTYPCLLSITGNAGGIAGNVVITGTNICGETITDTIALSGSSTVNGTKAFRTVTSIQLPVETHAGTDTISIGTTKSIGLPHITSYNPIHFWNNVTDAGALTTGSTVETSFYTPAATMDGSALELTYLVTTVAAPVVPSSSVSLSLSPSASVSSSVSRSTSPSSSASPS